MNERVEGEEQAPTRSRRTLLTGGAVVAGAALGAGALAGAATSRSDVKRETFQLEVACLGDTFRELIIADPPEPNDRRGSTVAVEGWIYPLGTIPGEGFVATSENSIGRWFCSGFNLQFGERPEPHLNAAATFVFGTIVPHESIPRDIIVTSGLGGTVFEDVESVRPITGGSGAYFGVMGQAMRVNTGKNNTVLYGSDIPAPNFLYTFELLRLV